MADQTGETPAAASSDRWTRRIGVVTLVLAVALVALLLAFPPGGSGNDVSDECREARDRATMFVRFPSPMRLEEMRRACASAR